MPITVAAVVTRQVIADSYRATYLELRRGAEEAMHRELRRLATEMTAIADGIADPRASSPGRS